MVSFIENLGAPIELEDMPTPITVSLKFADFMDWFTSANRHNKECVSQLLEMEEDEELEELFNTHVDDESVVEFKFVPIRGDNNQLEAEVHFTLHQRPCILYVGERVYTA